ncbi:TetR family transcriptional regulator [Stappia sp. GBMRC 2046]|uniref:TetR family transcriptional regulator n=1 Tax=Stappia sediminis TaxID=2692190 RepID=A0A7X3S834_9HYPH|nr:TetR/AcrR family transcriptional regulator [Stappia sediminis]MXN65431.1 TetR family transcriptional regulator [Stappia sediminis]
MIFMNRPYKLKRRAESQARTRQKIVDATIALHQERGLSATTVSEIAERANVGKVTVYRHFPDDEALLGACSGKYFEMHPLPDPERWRVASDPRDRMNLGLSQSYAYHRETEAMIARVMPEARDHPVMAPYFEHWRHAVSVLAEVMPVAPRQDEKLHAVLALALSFETWRLLVREQGLTDEQAIEAMMRIAAVER